MYGEIAEIEELPNATLAPTTETTSHPGIGHDHLQTATRVYVPRPVPQRAPARDTPAREAPVDPGPTPKQLPTPVEQLPALDVADEVFARLLRGASRGDDRAVDSLVAEFIGPITTFVRGRGADDPEEMANWVLYQALHNHHPSRGESRTSFRAMLYTIARRRLVDESRHRSARPDAISIGDESMQMLPDLRASTFDNRLAETAFVQDLLRDLSPGQREVIQLRFLEDLSIEDTARKTGKDKNAVKQIQHRAIRSLRRALGVVAALVLIWIAARALDEPETIPVFSDGTEGSISTPVDPGLEDSGIADPALADEAAEDAWRRPQLNVDETAQAERTTESATLIDTTRQRPATIEASPIEPKPSFADGSGQPLETIDIPETAPDPDVPAPAPSSTATVTPSPEPAPTLPPTAVPTLPASDPFPEPIAVAAPTSTAIAVPPTVTPIPVPPTVTPRPQPTTPPPATAVAVSPTSPPVPPAPTATSVPRSAPAPKATAKPTATTKPQPTATPKPEPTATPKPRPTSTPTARPTAAAEPAGDGDGRVVVAGGGNDGEVAIDILVEGGTPDPTAVASLVADTIDDVTGPTTSPTAEPAEPTATPVAPTATSVPVFTPRVEACGVSENRFMLQMNDPEPFATSYVVSDLAQNELVTLIAADATLKMARSGRPQLSWNITNWDLDVDKIGLVFAQNPGETMSRAARCLPVTPGDSGFDTD